MRHYKYKIGDLIVGKHKQNYIVTKVSRGLVTLLPMNHHHAKVNYSKVIVTRPWLDIITEKVL